MPACAQVVLFTGVNSPLDYSIPENLRACVSSGVLVRVPLRNRQCFGLVISVNLKAPEPNYKLKPIANAVHTHPIVSDELLALAQWMRRYYASSLSLILQTLIPEAVRREPKAETFIKIARTLSEEELQSLWRGARKQAALYTLLSEHAQAIEKSKALEASGTSQQTCKALLAKAILRQSTEAPTSPELGPELIPTPAPPLSSQQQAAVEAILQSLQQKTFKTHLLHGLTGSGKTEVYLAAAQHVLAEGNSVLFLIPELSLASQTLQRLRARLLPEQVHLWHHRLSKTERAHTWTQAAQGHARVILGARSAVFAPLQKLKLIIVDEEHDSSYKQNESPHYHGRDVAVYRAQLNSAVCILGSATPSLESIHNAERGRYAKNTLSERVDSRQLPKMHILNLQHEKPKNRSRGISGLLEDKIADRLEKKEQIILFINRRAFASSTQCGQCDFIATCPNCDIPLKHHKSDQSLRCHWCGHQSPLMNHCPECGAATLQHRGLGTQRLELNLKQLFPSAAVARIDADILASKNKLELSFQEFRAGRIDMLVGTQMLAKGLDFPNVTLVGLIDADMALHMPDFRAAERSFQLLVQVSGRAGRGDKAGEVVLQSALPHNAPLQYARRGQFEAFHKEQLEQRRQFNYPPFRHLIRHLMRGKDPKATEAHAENWAEHLQKHLGSQIEIRGPAPAPLEKINHQYRFHIWYFVPSVSKIIDELTHLRKDFKKPSGIIDTLDVDPVDVL